MSNKIPAYIIKHAEALKKAYATAFKHADVIQEWVDKNGGDGFDFYLDYGLGRPYEYDLNETIEALRNM